MIITFYFVIEGKKEIEVSNTEMHLMELALTSRRSSSLKIESYFLVLIVMFTF